ncbi:hypothetical protein [Aquitalea aquatica]|uniref:Uncharacterized protein n=1 Tax=Aquitalea aquatica TaxID=3044273 RepID=A0A838Y3K0_9NEIS|nr:hypothetical protein [Aquitalea magnusonii]MBA4708458.1 hypothetical protein [Aquitalea magnusonii]
MVQLKRSFWRVGHFCWYSGGWLPFTVEAAAPAGCLQFIALFLNFYAR